MDFLKDLKMSLLNFNFVMIYIIHKMLILIRNNLNYLKDSVFECFFKAYNRLLYFFKKLFFYNIIMEILIVRNLFRLKREQNYIAIKDIRNLFRQEKETKTIKDRMLRDIKNLFEHEKEEENYYKLLRVTNFWSNNYTEYKNNCDTNQIKHYQLKNILIKLDHI